MICEVNLQDNPYLYKDYLYLQTVVCLASRDARNIQKRT